jgi:endonuclease/exonuclease/phosphatase family metal-dependent hydrolase
VTYLESFKTISWNVAGRVKKQPRQIHAVLQVDADIVALQEIILSTQPKWVAALSKAGYFVICSFDFVEDKSILIGGRRYGTLIASRWEFDSLSPNAVSIPWNERLLSIKIDAPFGPIEFHNIHMPAGVSHRVIKIQTFEGLYQYLAHPTDALRILCGDFNSPREEYTDGRVLFWGKTIRDAQGVLFNDPNDRQANAERSILTGLAEYDLADAYRKVHGYERGDYSWTHKWRERRTYRRFDHVFASSKLNPIRCEYHHDILDKKLSDHASIVAEFSP